MMGPSRIAGIDVAKNTVEVFVLETGDRLQALTTPSGLAALGDRLQALGVGLVGLEASGGYERRVVKALIGTGLGVRVLNPLRVRRYATALNLKAKNDRLDAQVIAAFTAATDGPLASEDARRESLRELVAYRRRILEELTALKHQTALLENEEILALVEERRRLMQQQCTAVECRIVATIEADPAMARLSELFQSVPGVGPVLAWTLIAEMPEIGRLTRWQVAALAGLAPYDDDSGGKSGQRHIAGGRKTVRNALYMAAMVGRTHNPVIAELYNRLTAKGKKGKVALTAAMRKLIVILNAIARDNQPWSYEG